MIDILDILKGMVRQSDDVKEIVSLCEAGDLSCETVQISRDEDPHQLSTGAEAIIFAVGSGIIIIGDVFERIILSYVYTIAPGVTYAVIPDETLEGFLFLPRDCYLWDREYYRGYVPDRVFNYAFYKEMTSFKRAIIVQFFREMVDIHDPHLDVKKALLPPLTSMIKQLSWPSQPSLTSVIGRFSNFTP